MNGIMGALKRAGKTLDFIQVRHEEMAAFMACAHAKLTGEVGVCMATSINPQRVFWERGIRIDKPKDIGPAWDEALSSDRPVVYEAYTDPNARTLPPHITFKMAAAYSSALWKGDPEEGGIIKQTIKDAAATVLPH